VLASWLDVAFGNLGAIRGERVFSGRIREIIGEVNIEASGPIPLNGWATDLTKTQQEVVVFSRVCLHQAMVAPLQHSRPVFRRSARVGECC